MKGLPKKVFLQLIKAMNYLQQNGFYNLDMKIKNIIYGSDFEIKLIEFEHYDIIKAYMWSDEVWLFTKY